MSNTIDNKVVEMQFDNRQFESGVKTSLNTIERLKQGLNFNDTEKKIDGLNKINFSGLTNGLQTVQTKFSAMQVIGVTALANLTNAAMDAGKRIASALLGPIEEGGKKRALNIAQAKFQFEGLGMDVEAAMKSASDAVDGTAYGLDSAAKAASMFGATGMKAGDDMTKALRGIAGVAAMTSSEYDDIANIFTTVAGNGRLMADQLNQLSTRGINAAAMLGQQLGKSEAEIRKMTSKGQIDFRTFAFAMDDAFGQHAKDANKTFVGAMSNIRAALSRIGADIYTPLYENMIAPMNEVRLLINKVRKTITPFTEELGVLFKTLSDKFVDTMSKINDDGVSFTNLEKLVNTLRTFLKLDGVTNILSGIHIALSNIGKVIGAVKAGFKDFFPATNGIILAQFADTFKNLMEFITPSAETLEQLRRVFSGVFAVIDLGISAIKALLKPMALLGLYFGDFAKNVLNSAAAFGDWLVEVNKSVKASGLFNDIADKICGTFIIIGVYAENAVASVKNFFSAISQNVTFGGLESIKTLFGNIKDKLLESGGVFETLRNVISSFFKGIAESINSSGGLFNKLGSMIGSAFSAIGRALQESNIAGLISNIFRTFISYATKLAGMFASLGMLDSIRVISIQFKQITQMIKGFSGGLSLKAGNALDTLNDNLTSLQKNIRVGVVTQIAISVGILAASMTAISKIDSDKLATSLGALSTLVAEMVGTLYLLTKISSIEDPITKAGGILVTMSVAIRILAGAMKTLSDIPTEGLIKSLGVVSVLLLELTTVIWVLSDMKGQVQSGALTLIGMATAILILSKAFGSFASLSLPEIGKGLLAVGGSLIILAGALQLMRFTLTGAASLLIASASLLVLSGVLKILSTMSLDAIGRSLLALGGSLVILAVGLTAMDASIPGALALTVASIGLLALSAALKVFGTMSLGEIGKGLLALAGSLAILAVGLTAMLIALPGAYALTVASVGLIALAVSLKMIATMGFADIAKGLITIALAMGILGGLGLVLTPATIGMLAFGASLMMVGAGLFLVGTGLTSLATGLMMFASMAPAMVDGAFLAIQQFMENLLMLLPNVAASVAESIVNVVVMIGDAAPKLGEAILKLGNMILDTIVKLVPRIIDVTMTSITSLLQAMEQKLPEFYDLILKATNGCLQAIHDNLPPIIQSGVDIIVSLIHGIQSAENQIIDAAFEASIAFINGLADSMERNIPIVMVAVENLLSSIVRGFVTGIKNSNNDLLQTGLYFIQGFIDGILSSIDLVVEAAGRIGQAALDGLESVLRIASPSKEAYEDGEYTGEGYIDGADSTLGDVEKAGQRMGETYSDSLTDTITKEIPSMEDAMEIANSKLLSKQEAFIDQVRANNAELKKEIVAQEILNTRAKANARKGASNPYEQYAPTKKKQNDYNGMPSDARQNIQKGNEVRKEEAKVAEETATQIEAANEKSSKSSKGSAASKKKDREQEFKDETGYWTKLLEIKKKGAESSKYIDMDLQEFSKSMVDDAKQLVEDYVSSIESGRDTILSNGSIFKEVEEQDAVSLKDMQKNLEAHNKQINEYAITMAQLQEKVKGTKLQEVISQMGVESLQELKAMNNASAEELNKMVTTYDDTYAKAGAAAIYQLEGMKHNIETKLANNFGLDNVNLDKFMSVFDGTIKSLDSFVRDMTELGHSSIEGFTKAAVEDLDGKGEDEIAREGKKMADDIEAETKDDWTDLGEASGGYTADGIVDGLEAKHKDLYNAGVAAAQEVNSGYNDTLDIASPSKVMKESGRWTAEGVIVGLKSMSSKLYNAGSKAGDTVMNSLRGALEAANDILTSDMDMRPTIRPVLDLSEIQNGMNSLQGMNGSIGIGANFAGMAASQMNARQANTNILSDASLLNDLRDALRGFDGNNTINNTFNIDGSQDPRLVADEVSRRIQQQVERRTAAWA